MIYSCYSATIRGSDKIVDAKHPVGLKKHHAKNMTTILGISKEDRESNLKPIQINFIKYGSQIEIAVDNKLWTTYMRST